MTQETLINDLKEINRAVSRGLWRTGSFEERPTASSGRLIFPKYSNNEKRVSEQEARFVYSRVVETRYDYFYSAETPTARSYLFEENSDSEGKSAMSDLSIYVVDPDDESSLLKVVNVEFKALNPKARDIHKDIVKLAKEAIPEGNSNRPPVVTGNWYHLLENVNRGTIPNLFGKFHGAMKSKLMDRNLENNGLKPSDIIRLDVLFTFCILEKGLAIERLFTYDRARPADLHGCWELFFPKEEELKAEPVVEAVFPASVAKKWKRYKKND